MDDIKVLLYIVFGVIYVISRVMKSRKKKQIPSGSSEERTHQAPEKELSFEDLLKEFTEGKKEEPTIRAEEPVKQEKVSVEEKAWTGSDDEATSVYEKSIRDAEKIDMKDQGHNHHLERFGVFEEEEEDTFLAELSTELQEEDGLKKAVIYKEILDRKHF